MPFSIDGELSVGDNAQLTCHVARGDMPINISWTFRNADGGTSGPLPEPMLLNRIGKKIVMLEIPSVTEYHRGSYTCTATNRAGVIEHTAELMVNGNDKRTSVRYRAVQFFLSLRAVHLYHNSLHVQNSTGRLLRVKRFQLNLRKIV